MTPTKRQLVAVLLGAPHVSERGLLAAFVDATGTAFVANPFARTSAGAVQQVWVTRAFEFRALGVEAAGLPDLLREVAALPTAQPLVQEILRAGPHTLNLFHHGDACRIVGAVLYGRADRPLPDLEPLRPPRPRRGRTAMAQLDLFAARA